MAEQLDVKLVLETNGLENAGRLCELLSKHGVGNVYQFSTLTEERLSGLARESGMDDYMYFFVRSQALPKAQKLTQELVTSPQNLAIVKQQLLVRARMHH